MLITNAGARAFIRAHFGQGTGPIALDNIQCNTLSHRRLLECPHLGFYVENCGHHEDAGVSCILNRVNGTLNATPWPVNVLNTTYSATVLLTWEQTSEEGDRPLSFRVDCKSRSHSSSVTLSVTDNRSFTTPVGGLHPSTSYNCCVSAVYETMHTSEGACTLVETTHISITTMSPISSETESVTTSLFPRAIITTHDHDQSPVTEASGCASKSGIQPLVIGGVLGFVIIVLLILLVVMCLCVVRLRANSKTDERYIGITVAIMPTPAQRSIPI